MITHNKRVFLLSIIFLLSFIITINSALSYEHIGGDNRDFKGGLSSFNSEANVTPYIITPASSITFPLLSADLNNDGNTEILALSTGTLYIYSDTLTLLDSYTLDENSYFLDTTDMDSDNLIDIVVQEEDQVEILEYNTSIVHIANHSIVTSSNIDDFKLLCDIRKCVSLSIGYGSSNGDLVITPFNQTNVGDTTALNNNPVFRNTNAQERFCVNKLGGTVADYDNNGNNEFIISGLYTSDSNAERLDIYVLSVDSNFSTYTEELKIEKTLDNYLDADNCQDSEYETFLSTNAIVAQLDNANTPQLEIIAGVKKNTNDFRIYMFDYLGSEIDDYPELKFGDVGDYAINIYLADWYNDYGFCMPYYDNPLSKIYVECANEFKSDGFLGINNYLRYSYDTDYNLSSYPGYTMISHSLNANSSSEHDEILNNYGVVSLIDATTTSLNYDMPYSNIIVTPDDLDGDGYADLMIWDSPSIKLLLSSPINYGCLSQPNTADYDNCFSQIIITPNPDKTWLQNTTVSVQTELYDFDNSLLQVNIELYADNANSQNTTWQGNYSSGDAPIFTTYETGETFNANVTGTHKLRIKIRDLDNPTEIYTLTKFFTVSDSYGITHDDGERKIINSETPDTGLIDETQVPTGDNIFKETGYDIAQTGGISLEKYVLLIAVMAGIGLFISTLQAGKSPVEAGGYSVAGVLGVILIGAIFDMISVTWIIIPLVLSIGGYFLVRFIFRTD